MIASPEQLRDLAYAATSTTEAVRWRSPKVQELAWQVELGDVCDKLVDSALTGTGYRCTVSAPPRHGKTEWTGRGMTIRAYLEAWLRGLTRLDAESPTFAVLYVTASGDRAGEVSDQVRSAVERIYQITGDETWAPGRIWTRTEWQTRGGLRWTACGWSAATGGVGAHLLIMDDLIGSSEVYRSPAKRKAIRRVVQEDLLSRLMSGGAALHMETRRGLMDTTAWLHEEYGEVWEDHTWRCYDRATDTYLWPEVYGEAWRATMPHLTDDSPIWRSLYQQEPIAEGGTLIADEWLDATYSEPPEIAAGLADLRMVGVDLASTGKSTSDPCAFVVIAARGGYRDVLFAHQSQMTYTQARRYLRDLCEEWNAGAVVELAANGDAVVDDLASEIPGLRGERATRDKVQRLTPHLPMMAARQLRLPAMPAPWRRGYRQAMTAFTGTDGEDDHYVDASVWALVGCDTSAQSLTTEEWAQVLAAM